MPREVWIGMGGFLNYSLLLGMGKHIARSVQLHQCGLELGLLARRLCALAEVDQTLLSGLSVE